MSESGEEQEEEAWSREDDELIPRRTSNFHHSTDEAANSHQIPYCRKQHKSGLVSADLQNDNTKNDKKEGFIKGNRRKLQEKAKQMLVSPVGRLRKHLEGTKNMMATTENRHLRSPAPPFPYDGKDFGGSPSYRYLCFRPPSIPSSSDSPRKDLGTAESPRGGKGTAVVAAKPNHSSHYLFVKSLLEKNQFYSPECNPHR